METGKSNLWDRGSQSVVPVPAATAPVGKRVNMHILGPRPTPAESETLGCSPEICVFS